MRVGAWTALWLTMAIQAIASMAILTLPVMAPAIAQSLRISASLIGVYVSLVYCGAMSTSLIAGGVGSNDDCEHCQHCFARRIGAIAVAADAAGGLWCIGHGLERCLSGGSRSIGTPGRGQHRDRRYSFRHVFWRGSWAYAVRSSGQFLWNLSCWFSGTVITNCDLLLGAICLGKVRANWRNRLNRTTLDCIAKCSPET